MTRVLSELLGAPEPHFRYSIRELERASGQPSVDIRLTTEILHQTQAKLQELGLDPHDTTGQELYETLRERLLQDDRRLRGALSLQPTTDSTDTLASLRQFVNQLGGPRSCFALKSSTAKRLLKKLPPHKTMKHLGYRSIDSMLKHEPAAQLYAGALIVESAHWQRLLAKQYQSLSPSDFEHRQIEIYFPTAKRWEPLAEKLATDHKQACLTLSELGAIVMLPIQVDLPALAITTVLLLLENINNIRCSSALLKLQQVKPDFGKLVAQVATGETYNVAQLGGRSLPWRIMQYHYSKLQAEDIPALFDPHIQPEDLQLVRAEAVLAERIPALEFWVGTNNLAMVRDSQPVSLNMLDVALSATNQLPFDGRIVHYVRDHVWRELLERYLNPSNLEQALRQLNDELVGSTTAELAIDRELANL